MSKRVRRIVVLLVVGAGLIAAVSLWVRQQTFAVPLWYQRSAMTETERKAATSSATRKAQELQGQVASAASAEVRRETTRPAAVTVSFTQSEIDAYLDVWLDGSGYRPAVERYVRDPVIRLHDGRLVVAGKMPAVNRVISLHFEPLIGVDGRVQLELDRVTAGRVSVPITLTESLGDRAVQRMERDLAYRLPPLQQQAQIASDGVANRATIEAWQMIAGLQLIRGEPVEPVLFLPVYGEKVVPVRFTGMLIADDALTLSVIPMTPDERAALLAMIRSPRPPQ
jgi:hypothetical protein